MAFTSAAAHPSPSLGSERRGVPPRGCQSYGRAGMWARTGRRWVRPGRWVGVRIGARAGGGDGPCGPKLEYPQRSPEQSTRSSSNPSSAAPGGETRVRTPFPAGPGVGRGRGRGGGALGVALLILVHSTAYRRRHRPGRPAPTPRPPPPPRRPRASPRQAGTRIRFLAPHRSRGMGDAGRPLGEYRVQGGDRGTPRARPPSPSHSATTPSSPRSRSGALPPALFPRAMPSLFLTTPTPLPHPIQTCVKEADSHVGTPPSQLTV